MKFVKESGTGAVNIPKALLKLSGLSDTEKLDIHALDGVAVLLKREMTAMELLTVINNLDQLSDDLLTELIAACGKCVSCEAHCHFCQENRDIHLPKHLLDAADIPVDAQLRAEADPDTGRIIVSIVESEHDLDDVPEELLDELLACDVCLGSLNELLSSGDIVYVAH